MDGRQPLCRRAQCEGREGGASRSAYLVLDRQICASRSFGAGICRRWHPHATRIAAVSEGGEFSLGRSEEHTSELQSLMRISYAVFCLKQKNTHNRTKLL